MEPFEMFHFCLPILVRTDSRHALQVTPFASFFFVIVKLTAKSSLQNVHSIYGNSFKKLTVYLLSTW